MNITILANAIRPLAEIQFFMDILCVRRSYSHFVCRAGGSLISECPLTFLTYFSLFSFYFGAMAVLYIPLVSFSYKKKQDEFPKYMEFSKDIAKRESYQLLIRFSYCIVFFC